MTAAAPMTDRTAYFDAMYGHSADPYALRTRWYEQRKRAVLMAALPHPRYGRAYEPGCGAAELTVELATRCDHVLASDFSDNAVMAVRWHNWKAFDDWHRHHRTR